VSIQNYFPPKRVRQMEKGRVLEQMVNTIRAKIYRPRRVGECAYEAADRCGNYVDPLDPAVVSLTLIGLTKCALDECGYPVNDFTVDQVLGVVAEKLPKDIRGHKDVYWNEDAVDLYETSQRPSLKDCIALLTDAHASVLLSRARKSAVALAERPKVF